MSQLFELQNNKIFVEIQTASGFYNTTQFQELFELQNSKEIILIPTENKRLGCIVTEEQLAELVEKCQSLGLILCHYNGPMQQPISCLGKLCPFSNQDPGKANIEIAKNLAATPQDIPVKIGINGCERSCIPSHTMDISIVATEHGYNLSIGGKQSLLPQFADYLAEGIPEQELPGFIDKILSITAENREEGDTLHDVKERTGASEYIEALAPYSQDAASDMDTSFDPKDLAEMENEPMSEMDKIDPSADQTSSEDLEDDMNPSEANSSIEEDDDYADEFDIDSESDFETDLSEDDLDNEDAFESNLVEDEADSEDEFAAEINEDELDEEVEIDETETFLDSQDSLVEEPLIVEDGEEVELELDEEEFEMDLSPHSEVEFESSEAETITSEIEADEIELTPAQPIDEEKAPSPKDNEEEFEQRFNDSINDLEEIQEGHDESESSDREQHLEAIESQRSELQGNPASTSSSPSASTTIAAVNMIDRNIQLTFSNGMDISFEIDRLSEKQELQINGNPLSISIAKGKITLVSQGVSISLPVLG